LVAYGITETTVREGTVVGFVGTTGNAIGTHPHNHFEWHPDVIRSFDEYIEGTNGAVNPFPYLKIVCPPG
jgi:murein DD-endopeptidase MepM/ murein hydrolase activator NlpD